MAGTLILNFGRCEWGKCLFCGYGVTYGRNVVGEEIKKRIDEFFSRLEPNETDVKVFGSGSFFDEKQMPTPMRDYFIKKCVECKVKKVTVESRPEFITEDKLDGFNGLALTVAIGLEVADNRVLDKIRKGFHTEHYEKAAKTIHDSGCLLRTYLLVNPPYVSDIKKSLNDSVEYALNFSDSIVLINMLPHESSRLFDLWVKGEWNFLSKEEFHEITSRWAKNNKVEFDAETFRFTPRFPKHLQKPLNGVGEEYLTHPYFEIWHDYIIRWYKPPKDKRILLFLPCSRKKPYSESDTHKRIIEALRKTSIYDKVHQVMLSNAGIIPREIEDYYPFNSYDWDEKLETPEIKERYITVTSKRIGNYLTRHKNSYNSVYCFLKYDSESYKALKEACTTMKIKLTNLFDYETYKKIKDDKKPLQNDDALAGLLNIKE